jgi:hypothetical protein
MAPLYLVGLPAVLCLINWDTRRPVIDDGSYENWLEGTRLLESAIKCVPIDVTLVSTSTDNPDTMPVSEAIASLTAEGITRVFVAGNYIEDEIVAFATALIGCSIEATVLFDVCGTRDPMAKWQALAAIVDQGARVSTVQQTLRQVSNELPDPAVRARLLAILHEGMGEHAVELSAA